MSLKFYYRQFYFLSFYVKVNVTQNILTVMLVFKIVLQENYPVAHWNDSTSGECLDHWALEVPSFINIHGNQLSSAIT